MGSFGSCQFLAPSCFGWCSNQRSEVAPCWNTGFESVRSRMVHLFYFVLLTGNLLHCEAMKNRAAKLKDDVLSSGGESTWWDAFAHMNELEQYCQDFQGSQWLDVLDIFAHGRGMEGVVGSHTCTSFDIRLERVRHDLTTRRGTLMLLGLGMSLTHGALVTAAPPCSLSIFISSSVHKGICLAH